MSRVVLIFSCRKESGSGVEPHQATDSIQIAAFSAKQHNIYLFTQTWLTIIGISQVYCVSAAGRCYDVIIAYLISIVVGWVLKV